VTNDLHAHTPAWYAGTRARVEARAALGRAEESGSSRPWSAEVWRSQHVL
jgi:hypothetical protein